MALCPCSCHTSHRILTPEGAVAHIEECVPADEMNEVEPDSTFNLLVRKDAVVMHEPTQNDELFLDPGGNTLTLTIHEPVFGSQQVVAYKPAEGALCEGCGREPLVIRWVIQDPPSSCELCHICVLGIQWSPEAGALFSKEV